MKAENRRRSRKVEKIAPPKDDIIAPWCYAGSDIPPAGAENPRINFWLMNGNATTNEQNAEIVIKSFKYLPDITPEIDFTDFALFTILPISACERDSRSSSSCQDKRGVVGTLN